LYRGQIGRLFLSDYKQKENIDRCSFVNKEFMIKCDKFARELKGFRLEVLLLVATLL
jgi:hypothetical protein